MSVMIPPQAPPFRVNPARRISAISMARVTIASTRVTAAGRVDSSKNPDPDSSAKDEAMAFLLDFLGNGPVSAKSVLAAAREAGICRTHACTAQKRCCEWCQGSPTSTVAGSGS
jgi:hypothetical protein